MINKRNAVTVGVLTGLVGLAVTPMLPAFGTVDGVPAVVIGLLVGVALAGLGAWVNWPALVVTFAGVVVIALVGGPVIGAPTVFGVIPTVAGLRAVAAAVISTWKNVLTLAPPLGASGDVVMAPFLVAFLGGAISVSIGLRARGRLVGLAAVVPVVVLVVANLLGTADTVFPGQLVGVVIAVVALVWSSLAMGVQIGRRPLVAGALVAVMTVMSVVSGNVATGDRFVLRDHVVPPFDPTQHPSPLAGFRAFVKQDDAVLFTVDGLPENARVRLAVLDRYDGTVWSVAGGGAAQGSGEFRRVGSNIPAGPGTEAEVTFTMAGLDGIWLPTVGEATSFDLGQDIGADLRYNDATGAAVLTTGINSGTTYTEDVVVADTVTDEEIGTAASADVVLPQDNAIPTSLVTQAHSIVRDASTPVEQVRALATWLSETGYFSHGLEGEYPSLPGHGVARMSGLIGESPMVGDSEQYASALALMTRSLNLKSRVVLGFVPGVGDAESAADATAEPGADGSVAVRGKDVQAWVEVAFAGVGWVAFDATPPTSRTATDQQEDEPTNAQPQVIQPPVQPPAPPTAPEEDTRQPQTDGPQVADERPVWVTALIWTGGGLGLILLAASPALLVLASKVRRRKRRRRATEPDRAVAGGWDEIVDAAIDLRRPPAAVDTRTESVHTVGNVGDTEILKQLEDLAIRADRATFAPTGPTRVEVGQYWADVDTVIRRMWLSTPWRSRVVGRISTRSLRAATRRPVVLGRKRS